MKDNKQIIFCQCNSQLLNQKVAEEVNFHIKNSNAQVYKLADLCGLCATQKQTVQELFSDEKESLVIACYLRAVKSLLNFAGVKNPGKNMQVLNFRELTTEQIKKAVTDFDTDSAEPQPAIEYKSATDWPSWYPVVDYDRCIGCGQCADFCLFGTYEKGPGSIKVINPQACKNNCPACGRICPHTAIIFPKYEQLGAVSGSDVIDEIAEQQKRKTDVDTILGSDIYKALERRKAKRRRIINTEAMDKALKEREEALKNKNQPTNFNSFLFPGKNNL